MKALITLHNHVFDALERGLGNWFLPTLARFSFAAVLLVYYWNSASGKHEGSLFTPSFGAYSQIFPKTLDAFGWDISQFGLFHKTVIVGATFAEYLLPLLILVGLFARLAALGMIGFITVQSLTDLYGHGLVNDPTTVGSWFDHLSNGLIMDQRTMWIAVLLILVAKGAGPLSIDRLTKTR